MSTEKIDSKGLVSLTLPPEELSVLALGEIKKLDFDEGEKLPDEAYLQTPDGDCKARVKRKGNPSYMGGRYLADYKITKIF